MPVPVRSIAPRPGELSAGWRVVFGIGWGAVVLALAAVWKASRIVGLATWWLGPQSEPRSIAISLAPFAVALLCVGAAIRNVRRLPWIGAAGALALLAVALGDVGRFTDLALVELAIAVAAMALSLASSAGVLHPVAPGPEAGSETGAGEPRR